MSTAKRGMKGHAPALLIRPNNPEIAKYEKMWQFDDYRKVAPGEECAGLFMHVVRPPRKATVVDFGCGTGRGALALALLGGLKVKMVDFAKNCLDADVAKALLTQSDVLSFEVHDLERAMDIKEKYGYCTDVMEHIPEDKVETVLYNIMKSAQHVFFQICTTYDSCGELIGDQLHLTVKSASWWLDKLINLGAMIHWWEERPTHFYAYVTAWIDTSVLMALPGSGNLNTPDEQITANVRSAIARDLQLCTPSHKNGLPVMLVGSGPSLSEFRDEIVERRKSGQYLITVNGAYNWALDQGITPSATIVCDAREFNKRFVLPIVPKCKYLLASQCHPATFDAVPKEQTWLWNGAMTPKAYNLHEEEYKGKTWWPVPGGSTVMLRAIPLLRMLGYYRQEIFGFDSCWKNGTHHAMPQPENDGERTLILTVNNGARMFKCSDWMMSQAHQFIELVKFMGDEVELAVRGDGLISYILETGAELPDPAPPS